MFILLPVNGFLVSLFRVPFLKIELLFQLNIADISIHLNYIFPKYFLLVKSLFNLPQTNI